MNKLLTMLSRRDADKAISSGRVFVNNSQACLGQTVKAGDVLVLDGKIVDWESIWNSRKIGKQVCIDLNRKCCVNNMEKSVI